MNNKFQERFQQLLLQQYAFKGSYLITEWNWGDAWDSIKEYVGAGPSKAEQAAAAAEQAAQKDPNNRIIQIAQQISNQDMEKAKQTIATNPQLHAHFSKITDPQRQRYFIANLVAQIKAKDQANAKAKAESTFNKPDPKTNEGKMYEIIEGAWGSEFAEEKWKIATKKKGVICVNKKGKPYFVALSKFNKYAVKYLKAAKNYVPKDDTLEDTFEDAIADAKINQKHLDTYYKQVTELLKNKPFEFSDTKVERYLDNTKQQKKILCLVKKGTEEKSSDKLISENIIAEGLLADLMTKLAAIKNPRVAKLKDEYEFKLVDVKKFAAKQSEYMDAIDELHKELTKEKADEKSESDKKEAKSKNKEEFLQKCKDFQKEFPASEIANLCDSDDWGGNDFKIPAGTKMYDWRCNESASWDNDEEIDSKEQISAFRNFLNTGLNSENPAHPIALANVIKKLIDKNIQPEEIFDEDQFEKMEQLVREWVGKAETINKEYPDFKFKLKSESESK